MVKYVKGNLLDSDCNYICHQVNCQGRMGSGIAKQIRERWPKVYVKYKFLCDTFDPETLLGSIDIDNTDNHNIVNIFGQLTYGYDGKQYTSYEAFSKALKQLKSWIPYGVSIGFPKNIGCGLGGGDWKVISAMIDDILGEDFDVYIYEYNPEED